MDYSVEHKDAVPARTCIVTRESGSPDGMIRFVAGPDGSVVPDLHRRLSGRGVWVNARSDLVDLAVENNLFGVGLKRQVRADDDLSSRIEGLLLSSALSAVSLARKAGECVTGFDKVSATLKKEPQKREQIVCLLSASDGSSRELSRLLGSARRGAVPVWRLFTGEQQDSALGLENVVHIGLVRGGASSKAVRCVEMLGLYRGVGMYEGECEEKRDE